MTQARPLRNDATILASLLVGDEPGGRTGMPPISEVLRAIRVHLGMEVAFLSEFTGPDRVFRHVDAASPDDCPVRVGASGPLEDSYCLRVVDGRLPELVHDARTVPAAAELPVTTALPVGAHISVPVRLADGTVYGTFCCFSTAADHSLNERDVAVMRVFAQLIGSQIDADAERELRRAETVARLEAAVAGEGVSMVFQPIVDVVSRRVLGFEALARFSSTPLRGPEEWFAEAAAAGFGVELELAAVRMALARLPQVSTDAYLAVNVSPNTVVSGRLEAVLGTAPAERVVLEITEHDAIQAYDQLEDELAYLRRRGVRVAVDDAGAGYASFRHILRLRPDLIKLDTTLTRDIDRDQPRRALASALIGFAGETGSVIVAEGVEGAAELDTLRRLGVSAAQGFHLGLPVQLPPVARTG